MDWSTKSSNHDIFWKAAMMFPGKSSTDTGKASRLRERTPVPMFLSVGGFHWTAVRLQQRGDLGIADKGKDSSNFQLIDAFMVTIAGVEFLQDDCEWWLIDVDGIFVSPPYFESCRKCVLGEWWKLNLP